MRDAFGVSKSSQNAQVKTARLIMRLKRAGDTPGERIRPGRETRWTGNMLVPQVERFAQLDNYTRSIAGKGPNDPNYVRRARQYLMGRKGGHRGVEEPKKPIAPPKRTKSQRSQKKGARPQGHPGARTANPMSQEEAAARMGLIRSGAKPRGGTETKITQTPGGYKPRPKQPWDTP